MVQPNNSDRKNSFLCINLLDQIGPQNRHFGLAKLTQRQVFEGSYWPFCATSCRLENPVRLVAGLLIIEQLDNLSDGLLVEAWTQNPSPKTVCGHLRLSRKLPCDPSDLTHFLLRAGGDGIRRIFEASFALHGDKAKEVEAVLDPTVQERNITSLMDTKLLAIIVMRRYTMTKLEVIKLLRSHQRVIKSLLQTITFRSKGRRQGESQRTVRRLRAFADPLFRELKGMLSPKALSNHKQALHLYNRVQIRWRPARSGNEEPL